MVRRRESDGINVLIFQELPDVGIALHFLTEVLAGLEFLVEYVLVHVTQGDHARPFDLVHAFDVVFAAAAEPDYRVADILVGARYARSGGGARTGGAVLGEAWQPSDGRPGQERGSQE